MVGRAGRSPPDRPPRASRAAGIAWNLLKGIDDDGEPRADAASAVGAGGQVYPYALPMSLPEGPPPPDSTEARRRSAFGDHTYPELIGQPSPRVLTTHLVSRDHLPSELVAGIGPLFRYLAIGPKLILTFAH